MSLKAAVAASFHRKIYDHTLTLILMVAASRSRQLITVFTICLSDSGISRNSADPATDRPDPQ